MQHSTRSDGLDGFRGLAAAAVVLLHVWMFSGAHQSSQSQLVDTVIGALGLSLMMFFVLSGYLVSRPWVRAAISGAPAPDLRRYAIRRAARILPAYWLMVVVSFVITNAISHPHAIDASQLPVFALFLQNQVPSTIGQLNPPMWSLGVEVQFYLLLPLIGAAMLWATSRAPRGDRRPLVALAALLALAGLTWTAMLQETGVQRELLMSVPTYLPIFACGIATAILIEGRAVSRPWRATLLIAGSLLAIGNGWWHSDGTGWWGQVLRDLPAGVGFGMMIAASVNGPARLMGSLPLRRLGDWSYGIYLWHMLMIYVFRALDQWPESPWLAYAYVMGSSTILGAASWILYERPIQQAVSRRLRRAARARSASPGHAPSRSHLHPRPAAPRREAPASSMRARGLEPPRL